jgi:16S rRNA (cytidine1402-2'-O)-methyltransferase
MLIPGRILIASLLLKLKLTDVNTKVCYKGAMVNRGEEKQGILYVVATPIGNLEDITLRAIRILKEADLIAAEDTRRAKILLGAHNIFTRVVSLHEHNEKEKSRMIIARLQEGAAVAYISDAGTPGISDPGSHLVEQAHSHKIRVVPVPGASAVSAALSVSGFHAESFLFSGFLPSRENKRRKLLETLRHEARTIIFFESPKRISASLKDMHDILGDRKIVLTRELTKVFEEVRRGVLSGMFDLDQVKEKGEYTLIIEGASQGERTPTDDEIREMLMDAFTDPGTSLRDAVREITNRTGVARNTVYDIAVKLGRFAGKKPS